MKSNGGSQKIRSDRFATIDVSQPSFRQAFHIPLRGSKAWGHLLLSVLSAGIMWGITVGWMPPFSYRIGYVPDRNVVAAVPFRVEDPIATQALQRRAVAETICIYDNKPFPIANQLKSLQEAMDQVSSSESFDALDESVWKSLFPNSESDSDEVGTGTADGQAVEQAAYRHLHSLLSTPEGRSGFDEVLKTIFQPWLEKGVMRKLEHGADEGSFERVKVLTESGGDQQTESGIYRVSELLEEELLAELPQQVTLALQQGMFSPSDVPAVHSMLVNWISGIGIPPSLSLNRPLTVNQRSQQQAQVQTQYKSYSSGQVLAMAGKSLDLKDIELLRQEYDYRNHGSSIRYEKRVGYGLANFGMYLALFTLCGVYLMIHEPNLVQDTPSLLRLLGLATLVVLLATATANDTWRAELIPMVMFTMVVTICFRRDSALLLSSVMALMVAVATGSSLAEFIIVISAMATTCLLLGRLRSRVRLILIGLAGGLITLLTTMGVSTLSGQTFGSTGLEFWDRVLGSSAVEVNYVTNLLQGSMWYGFCVLLAGFFMTGLLPIIERVFGIQTDISLMELGDPAHPLLTELQRRAPGTFMHSLNVATLSEPAAEAIGANGLLCRVGSYFHDIGKMIKPEYFVENQDGSEENRHESLVPSMSRLVIISHVKDGSDLGRKHHLPDSIIDFILQHHGTTLVEYFYHQALHADDESEDDVDESDYRYPGPRPQTREAAVMMLADAVESACRSLDDPAPARIESLVSDLAMKRLLDGQFDECGLTLRELNVIQTSLIKTEMALLHNRIKYPEQQSEESEVIV